MPTGYGLSLIGAGVFFVGVVADLIWHTFLGVEANLAAEYSPQHLMLATAGILIATGPLRAAWHSEKRNMVAGPALDRCHRDKQCRRLADQLPGYPSRTTC